MVLKPLSLGLIWAAANGGVTNGGLRGVWPPFLEIGRNRPFSPFFCLFRPFPEGAKTAWEIQKTEEKGLFPQISSDLLKPPSLKPPFAALQLIEPFGGFDRTFLGWPPLSGYRFKTPSKWLTQGNAIVLKPGAVPHSPGAFWSEVLLYSCPMLQLLCNYCVSSRDLSCSDPQKNRQIRTLTPPNLLNPFSVRCANTQPFLCNELGPFQAISGNFQAIFRQFAWPLFGYFQAMLGNFRQF